MHLIIVTLILVSVTSGARIITPSSEVEEITREDLEHLRNDHEMLLGVLQQIQGMDDEIEMLEQERATRQLASKGQVMSKIMMDKGGADAFGAENEGAEELKGEYGYVR